MRFKKKKQITESKIIQLFSIQLVFIVRVRNSLGKHGIPRDGGLRLSEGVLGRRSWFAINKNGLTARNSIQIVANQVPIIPSWSLFRLADGQQHEDRYIVKEKE